MSQEIHKKATTDYFAQVLAGTKTFDLRLADWECREGDILVLDEIDDAKQLTGRSIRKKVGFVLKTKDFTAFPADQVDQYGYQVISLRDEATND